MNKFFCKFLEHLWCFLKGFWRLLVGPGKRLLVFFSVDFVILGAGPPVPFVPLVLKTPAKHMVSSEPK